MTYEAIINALAALLGGGVLVGLGKLVVMLRKSMSESREADAEIRIREVAASNEVVIKKAEAKVNEWQQLFDEMRKQLANADKKVDKIRAELQERMDRVQEEHLQCQQELAATKSQLHELHERLAKLEGLD